MNPRMPPEAPPPDDPERPAQPERTRRPTVLVLDDEAPLRTLMRVLLEAEGFQVIDTDDGHSAMEHILAENAIDLVLVNLMMPIMPGREFLRRLHELPAERRPPAVVVTGNITSPEENGYAELDIKAVLRKPFRRKDLIACAKALCRSPEASPRRIHTHK